jgi:hypothetical protein
MRWLRCAGRISGVRCQHSVEDGAADGYLGLLCFEGSRPQLGMAFELKGGTSLSKGTGAPKPVFLAGDRDDNLFEVPFVAEPAG